MMAGVCERIPGQDTCPFHPDHKITSLCKTCGILVCLECMMSKNHKEHEFKKISECLREPTNAIARYLTHIDKNLLKVVDQELASVKSERKKSIQNHTDRVKHIKEQGTKLKTEIDSTTNDMVVHMDKHLQEVLNSFDKHEQALESFRKYLAEERHECTSVLQNGSTILKFDVGNAVMDKVKKTKIPEQPAILDLQHIKCENVNDLIRKALGTLKEINISGISQSIPALSPTGDHGPNIASSDHFDQPLTPPAQAECHTYTSITTRSTWSNEDPRYKQITPITTDTAWSRYENNQIHLVTNSGQSLRNIQTDNNFRSLSVHPTTGYLYVGNYDDNTISSIGTEPSTASCQCKVTVQCDFRPSRIKVTKDNDILVGGWRDRNPVHRYKLTGKLVHKSPGKYDVWDIDQCTRTNRVVLSCASNGMMILKNDLSEIKSFSGLNEKTRAAFVCYTAIFDCYGNLIVGDRDNKEVYILDGNQYNLMQKLPIADMSCITMIRLQSNVMWVECQYPDKVMCIEMK